MPGDHKRKARPIGPATVTVTAAAITVVVPDVLGKNEALAVQDRRGLRHLSKTARLYRESVRSAVASLHVSAMFERLLADEEPGPLIRDGAWRLEVIGVWPRERHDVGFTAPMGDADAAIPQALDALQHAGVLDDDARVVEVRAWNLYRRGVRATVMRLVRVPMQSCVGGDRPFMRDENIAHLLQFVPQCEESPPKPARQKRTKP